MVISSYSGVIIPGWRNPRQAVKQVHEVDLITLTLGIFPGPSKHLTSAPIKVLRLHKEFEKGQGMCLYKFRQILE